MTSMHNRSFSDLKNFLSSARLPAVRVQLAGSLGTPRYDLSPCVEGDASEVGKSGGSVTQLTGAPYFRVDMPPLAPKSCLGPVPQRIETWLTEVKSAS